MKKILLLLALTFSSVVMADDVIGGILGGAIGGVIGHQFGKGDGNTAATIGGAVIGTMLGSNSNSRSYNDEDYDNRVYSQRYVAYAQPQRVYYVQPQQMIYVQQAPRVVYTRRHQHNRHHDDYYCR